MARKDELVPLKLVAEEVGMSRTSLWRAARSAIAGFPPPVVIRRLVYWRRQDLDRLDDALARYRGRVEFERQREAQRRIARLQQKLKRAPKRSRPDVKLLVPQQDLFGGG